MWPTENAWPYIILSLVLGVILFIIWFQRQQTRFLVSSGLTLIAAMGFWILDQAVVTPREEVTSAIYGITSAFQQSNIDETLGHISDQEPRLKMMAGNAIQFVKVHDDMRVTDISIEMSNQETLAKTRFRVNATVTAQSPVMYGPHWTPTYWEARWRFEGDRWKMINLTQLDRITGEQSGVYMKSFE